MSRRVALVVVTLLASLLTGCSSDPSTSSKSSSPAPLPEVTLASFTGDEPLDVSAIKGPAVINLWASWCGPCRRDLPIYQAYAAKHSRTVTTVGIDFQDTRTDKARELIRTTGVRFPLYSDPDGMMRARALPDLILVDAQGKVTYRRYVEITSVDQLEKLVETHLGVSP